MLDRLEILTDQLVQSMDLRPCSKTLESGKRWNVQNARTVKRQRTYFLISDALWVALINQLKPSSGSQ